MAISYQYIAGLVDGEGCVGLYANGNGNYAQHSIRIGMVHSDVLAAIADQESGHFRVDKRGVARLAFYGKAAIELARKILPYSWVKREELELMLEAAAASAADRSKFIEPMRELKKRNSLCR